MTATIISPAQRQASRRFHKTDDITTVRTVFVYGTLLSGLHNARLWEPYGEAVDCDRAFITGHRLFGRTFPFPYVIADDQSPSGEVDDLIASTVVGEALRFSDDVYADALSEMDHLEGVGYHYDRSLVDAHVSRCGTVGVETCWIYTPYPSTVEYRGITADDVIESGSWRDRHANSAANSARTGR